MASAIRDALRPEGQVCLTMGRMKSSDLTVEVVLDDSLLLIAPDSLGMAQLIPRAVEAVATFGTGLPDRNFAVAILSVLSNQFYATTLAFHSPDGLNGSSNHAAGAARSSP
jgi:hypothetical protein